MNKGASETGRDRIIGRLVDPHHVVVAHGQVEGAELAAHILQRLRAGANAAKADVERASETLRDLRIAKVVEQDVQLKDGKVELYQCEA